MSLCCGILQGNVTRSSYPPGYTGHQAGRYSVIGASNPAGTRVQPPLQSVAECIHQSPPVAPELEIASEPMCFMDDNLLNQTFQNSSINETSRSPQPHDFGTRRTAGLSYCNPGYVQSKCIPNDTSTPPRGPDRVHPDRTLTLPLPSCFDGKGTGFAVGHNRETFLWDNHDTSMSTDTEYREQFQPRLRKSLAIKHDSNP